MNSRRYVATGVLLGLLAAAPAFAPGGAPESLARLFAASSGVVVGKVVQGAVSGTTVTLSIQIERVLEGNWAPGEIVAAAGTITEPVHTHAAAVTRGVFFLANAGTGPMRLIPVISGFVMDEWFTFILLPDSSAPAVQPAPTSSLRERVLLEVMGGLEAGPAKHYGGGIDVVAEYQEAPTPLVRSVFQSWLNADTSWQVADGLQALLAEGDLTALSRVASSPALRTGTVQAGAFKGLRFYFKNADPAAVSLLGQLAGDTSNSSALRIAAASALARIHTRQALPFLAGFLDSSDLDMRILGVGGLSMFANNVPIGSHEPAAGEWPWRTEDTIAHSAMSGSNAAFWKSWWTANQAVLSR